MTEVIPSFSGRLVSLCGCHCTWIRRGEEKHLNEALLEAYHRQVEALPKTPIVITDTARMDQIKEAVKMILEAGDDQQLTVDKQPKIRAVEALTGFKVTRDECEQAIAEV